MRGPQPVTVKNDTTLSWGLGGPKDAAEGQHTHTHTDREAEKHAIKSTLGHVKTPTGQNSDVKRMDSGVSAEWMFYFSRLPRH